MACASEDAGELESLDIQIAWGVGRTWLTTIISVSAMFDSRESVSANFAADSFFPRSMILFIANLSHPITKQVSIGRKKLLRSF